MVRAPWLSRPTGSCLRCRCLMQSIYSRFLLCLWMFMRSSIYCRGRSRIIMSLDLRAWGHRFSDTESRETLFCCISALHVRWSPPHRRTLQSWPKDSGSMCEMCPTALDCQCTRSWRSRWTTRKTSWSALSRSSARPMFRRWCLYDLCMRRAGLVLLL